ncbi:MAG: hypothetical protein KGS72_29005 [Cyanobacteria bacterium REEB67]|nr:hypothetical protein [Cyanobacteria bacterium REEB67]
MLIEVSKNKYGGILVLTDDGFAASFKNGRWLDGIHFDASDQMDNHSLVPDSEAKKIYKQAKEALRKQSVVA